MVDIGLSEIWLKVVLGDSDEPRSVELKRDGEMISSFSLVLNDTVVVDTGLALNRTYQYQATRLRQDRTDASEVLSVTTLDTTSHDFLWQTFTLGDGSSSQLNDVAIIDENNIWAVGEIYLKDSTGQFSDPAYNAVTWDGTTWDLRRILVRDWGGITGYFPLEAVFSFAANNTWFASFADLIQWNGTDFIAKAFFMTSIPFDGQVTRMWGSSNSEIYCVGRTGAMYQYLGQSWQKLESGTTADMHDVWGNTITGTAFAVASSSAETKVLTISDSQVLDTLNWPVTNRLRGIWVSSSAIYVSGSGIWRHNGTGWSQMPGLPSLFYTRVRGSADNNIVAVSWGGVIAHYNGSTWHTFPDIPTDFNFEGVDVSKDLVAAVGFTGGIVTDKAAVVIGRRIP